MERWPEGRAADPVAARERYVSDLQVSRRAVREVFRRAYLFSFGWANWI
ncbi:hypothetical protein [Streptomyces sp. CC208A]|nr:hypothetical protein [Streptomyces sp. CC208A]